MWIFLLVAGKKLLITLKKNPTLQIFRDWLRRMHILAPVPQLIGGESHNSFEPLLPSCQNLADYLTALLNDYPATYNIMLTRLKNFMPDLKEFSNKLIATDARMIRLHFGENGSTFDPILDQISDGEKCMFLCAVVLASQKVHNNFFVFWDEPDNYLALTEIETFIRTLRRNFRDGSQIWMTSHNENTINCFSHENILLMRRKDHFDPVELRPIHEVISDTDSIIHKIRLNDLE
jgi:predicted ATPase